METTHQQYNIAMCTAAAARSLTETQGQETIIQRCPDCDAHTLHVLEPHWLHRCPIATCRRCQRDNDDCTPPAGPQHRPGRPNSQTLL